MIRRFLVAGLLILLASAPIRAQLATATVTPATPGKSVQPDFGGITTDVFSSATMMGTPANGKNLIYRQLAKNLIFPKQSLFFTMEGDDSPSATLTADHVLGHANVFTDLQAAGFNATWHMPANMCSNNQSFANGEVNLYTANMPIGSLAGIVLGNEPDGVCSSTYGGSYAAFKTKWDTYRSGINGLVGASTLKFMAPSFGGELSNVGYRGSLNAFVTAETSVLSVASQHWYALNNTSAGCGGNTPTITQLLAAGAATPATIDANFPTYVTNAHTQGLPFRMTEMNTVVCGGASGVSNTFASALWITDALFNLANMGVDGVGIFSDIGQFYDMFGFTIGGSAPNKTYAISFIRPEYYGFLMFQEATQHLAKLVPCSITTSSNVTCWATIDELNTVRVVVLNKDQVATGNVTITLAGYGTAQFKTLTAPAVTSTTGVSYGGRTFDGSTDGAFVGTDNSTTLTPSGSSYTFSMAKASAAMLTLQSSSTTVSLIRAPGWTKIQGTTLKGGSENINQCPANSFNGYNYAFSGACQNVITDPNSAVMDTKRNRMLLHGGGHGDYCGNEVYALDLTLIGKTSIGSTATGPLYRLDPPTQCVANNASAVEANPIGSPPLNIPTTVSPASRHTYGGVTYVPPTDQMFLASGALWPTGFSSNYAWTLPLGNVVASCAPVCDPKWVNVSTAVPDVQVSPLVEYDAGTQKIWYYTSQGTGAGLYTIDPTNYAAGWTLKVVTGMDYHMASVIDPDDEYFVTVGPLSINGSSVCGAPCGIRYFNLTGTVAVHNPTLDASCTSMLTNDIKGPRPGLEWDAIGRRIVVYPGYGNKISFIDPKTWICTSETYGATQGVDYPQNHLNYNSTGTTPPGTDPAINHLFGSFPALDVFPMINNATADAWYLNLRRGNVAITNTSGSTITNLQKSLPRAFRQGEIQSCANAFIDATGTYLPVATTQTDVKTRWPDGSLKYAIVSFVIPLITSLQTVHVEFENQASCNNTGQETKAQMLAAGYNFDGQIQLAGVVPHNISARTILTGATSISDCTGTDPDGTLATSGVTACYWLKGPIVTAVILEDRNGRTFDVNIDGNAGNPLHPRFEAWFYPQTSQVQLGYTLENTWASTTAANSARDQAFTVVTLTGGNTSPVTEFVNGAYTQLTRTMWHKTFCINGANAGSQNDCDGSTLHIDHNWRYWATTKLLPNWDSNLVIAPSKIASEWANLFSTGSDPRCGSAPCQPGNAALVLGGCTTCFTSNSTKGGIGYYGWSLTDTGSAEFHGPVPTWDTVYLLSQCDAGNSTSAQCGNGGQGDMRKVMLTVADLGGGIPYWYREADSNAGVGQTFDNSGTPGNVQTKGRVISINARQQVTLRDATLQNYCGAGHTADFINFGGSGQDLGGWGTLNLDMSHWPEVATVSYLFTGQYHYYEEEMMQGAYALAGSPGTTACILNPDTSANHRWAQNGYWGLDQERANDWQGRTNMLAATNAVDGSPEKAYFTDKLLRNIAVWEGTKGIPFDMTGPAYLSSDWTYGNTQRVNNTQAKPGPRGIWAWGLVPGYQDHTPGDFPTCGASNPTGCTQPGFANAHFQNAYSGFVAAWMDEQGYCPHPNGNPCGFLTFIAPFYFNTALNPEANIHQFDDYTFPVGGGVPDTTTTPLTSWTWAGNLDKYYETCGPSQTNPSWPCTTGQHIKTNAWKSQTNGGSGGLCSGTMDENYPIQSLAVMSFLYGITDAASGYKGSDAYNALYQSYMIGNGCLNTAAVNVANSSPKWAVTPRFSTTSVVSAPQTAPAVTLSPSSLTFSNQAVGTTSVTQTIQLSNTGTATLTITSVTLTGTNSGNYSIFSNPCGSSLLQGASCNIGIRFTPSSVGLRTANLIFTTNAASSPDNAALSGTGVAPIASFSPPILAFPAIYVGQPNGPLAITLTNTGNVTMTISSISVAGTNPGDFSQSNTCGPTLAASANCVINVTFTPLAAGVRQANIVVTDNTVLGTDTVAISGTGFLPITGVGTISGAGTIRIQP